MPIHSFDVECNVTEHVECYLRVTSYFFLMICALIFSLFHVIGSTLGYLYSVSVFIFTISTATTTTLLITIQLFLKFDYPIVINFRNLICACVHVIPLPSILCQNVLHLEQFLKD